MIKLAMINVQARLKAENAQSKMLLQVHDELIFDLYLNEKDQLTPLIKEEMENALILPNNVPAKVDLGFGENWLIAH